MFIKKDKITENLIYVIKICVNWVKINLCDDILYNKYFINR